MKIILATYTHPDFLPPVYEFYSVLTKQGHDVRIISSESDAQESLQHNYQMLTIKNTFGSGALQKIKYRTELEGIFMKEASLAEIVISFCEVSFLMIDKAHKAHNFRHLHHSLEMYSVSFTDFKRSPLSTLRKLRYLNRIKNCEFVSTPSYERSGWFTAICKFKTPTNTILNCQYIDESDILNLKDKVSRKGGTTTIVHTGGVNDTRSVFELVAAFHEAQIPNTKLIITNVRDNTYCKTIREYVSKHTITNIELLGPVSREELVEIQKNADIGICFMKQGQALDSKMLAPNKIGEYLKYGLSIIATDAPYYDIFTKSIFLVNDIKNKSDVVSSLKLAVQSIENSSKNNNIEILKWYNMEYQMRHLLKTIAH